jgi:hypothetical protein
MSGVFRKLTPLPSPLTDRRVRVPPAFGAGGGHNRWMERGWGVNSSEDARHCSVLYICKYFLLQRYSWNEVFLHSNKYNTEQFECQSRLVWHRVNVT